MNVSYEKVLAKMEQEIAAARNAPSGDAARHVYAIKSMCELLIGSEANGASLPRIEAVQPVMMQAAQPAVQQPEKIATEDGSNGDSIFDF